MKPMTADEISHLKIWAEKQKERRPAEILYDDILRLIATIQAIRVDDNCTVTTKDLIEAALKAERETCAQIATTFKTGWGNGAMIAMIIRARNDNFIEGQSEQKEGGSDEHA